MKCRKRICITAVLTAASLFCFFTSVRGDNASVTGTPRGGMVVEIACADKQSEQPPVSFPHERHTQALQKEGVVSCGLCHRAEGQDNAFVFTYSAAEKKVLSAKKDAYHAGCTGCHATYGEAGKTTGPLTAACHSCHDAGADMKPFRNVVRLDRAAHYRHITSGQLNSVDGAGCNRCHHEKAEEDSCSACHLSSKTAQGDVITLRQAAHQSCVNCHLRDRQGQADSAVPPTDCSACHQPRGRTASDKKNDLALSAPRLERGQPDTILLMPAPDGKIDIRGMVRPVAFNHKFHESRSVDCRTCHHKKIASCSSCHSLEGKAEGKFITLAQAMHSENILKRGGTETTPQSCVGCHTKQLQRKECAGCHNIVKPARDQAYCNVCHNVTGLTKAGTAAGIADKLPQEKNEEIAAKALEARENATPLQPADGPYKVMIGGIADQYKANMFAHRRHVDSLMERIKDDGLARAFHTKPESLCTTCHHRNPLGDTSPRCGSCHAPRNNNPAISESPQLKVAYHQQCMGCHKDMNVARPLNTSCTTCHKESVPQIAEKLGGRQ